MKQVFHIKRKNQDFSLCGMEVNRNFMKFETWSFKANCRKCLDREDTYEERKYLPIKKPTVIME